MKIILTLVALLLSTAIAPAEAAPRKMSTSKESKSTTRKAPTAAEHAEAEKESAKKLLSSLTTTQKSKLLTLLNKGSSDELIAIKGVAKTRAASIVKARPFEEVNEVILVDGVGEGTFTNVIAHAKTLTQRRSSKKKS